MNSNQITGTATVDGIAIDGTWSFVSGQAITAGSSAVQVLPLPFVTVMFSSEQVTVAELRSGRPERVSGLQNIEALNTPEKLETAMKTAITQANSGVPQANTAVYDVELQISTDGGTTWTKATAGNFPANGLTVTLPYPAGTNSSYTFTVVHMFTTSDFGKTPGDIETPRVINTGVLPATLGGQLDLVPPAVGDGQDIQHIAAVRGDGQGDGTAAAAAPPAASLTWGAWGRGITRPWTMFCGMV